MLNIIFPVHQRIRFKNGTLYLDSKEMISWKKKWNKNYELIDLIVKGIIKYQRLELSYQELQEIFLKDLKTFPYLYKSLNRKNIYEDTDDIEKRNILLDKTFNLSFFNSSLSIESNNQIEFILKKESTGLLVKGS